MNRREELKALLQQALNAPRGVLLTVTGSEPNRRQNALASIQALRRELVAHEPEMLNLQVRLVPNSDSLIAIIKIQDLDNG